MTDNGDRRMHEGRKPGLDEEREHERHEEPVDGLAGRERGVAAEGGEVSDMRDREQPSALGGDVATRSGTAETPEDERADAGDPA
ncbi:hypothetical protein D1610_13570 [Sphingomonas gilva]|uniref:Uncharacterized protein n=1 Tax=Sphingomonas gilva TaxID=2305907 RepID=A0A396RKH2_9SPHN|nr:hypothetical protein [Sphingomonas gilva]RHW16754.1 hypothetical protein D1610_13570 [Sphingomonas gilva]